MMKCYLSGMPELKLGLSEKMGNMTFHQCVNLAAFETQKVVTFIPPEGEFELMKYRSYFLIIKIFNLNDKFNN